MATLLFSITLVDAQQAVVHKQDIVKAVVEQFDRSAAVALGELHGSQADQDLRIQIIRSPDFARKVRIVVVEGLNSLHQDDLDRYIRGANRFDNRGTVLERSPRDEP
jgi:uncharacterized iron-regulated protein